MKKIELNREFALGGELLPILVYPNPILEAISTEVTEFNDELTTLVQNMLTTMYDAPGVGLAAPQIGVNKRLFVLDVNYDREVEETNDQDREDEDVIVTLENLDPMVFINPVITQKIGETTYKEGCLSLPDTFEDIHRALKVVVDYLDINGEKQQIEADGLMSICIQHENDHLDGITFMNYLSQLKKGFYRKQLLKEKRRRGQ